MNKNNIANQNNKPRKKDEALLKADFEEHFLTCFVFVSRMPIKYLISVKVLYFLTRN